MKVKIKRLSSNAVIPAYQREGDAGLDLTATSKTYDENGNIVYGTGLSIEIPFGYVGLLFPRSSISNKRIFLSNSVGVIDSNYRGEIMLKFKVLLHTCDEYQIGDRVGQLIIMPYPAIEFEEVSELSESVRGSNGFGSSGN